MICYWRSVAAARRTIKIPGRRAFGIWPRPRKKPPIPRHGIHTAVLSPDGRRVALASWAGDLWLHEVGGAELLYERFGMNLRMAFSPDGKLLVGVTESGQLRTWDGVTGKPIETDPVSRQHVPVLLGRVFARRQIPGSHGGQTTSRGRQSGCLERRVTATALQKIARRRTNLFGFDFARQPDFCHQWRTLGAIVGSGYRRSAQRNREQRRPGRTRRVFARWQVAGVGQLRVE